MKKGGTIFWSVLLTVVLLGAGAYGITVYRQANCEHVYGEGKVVKEATCEEDGVMEYECDECWKVKEEKIPATGHTVLQLDAVRATCTSTGLHAGEICEVCEKVLVPQEVIPMLNHDLETVEGKESTCTEQGYFEYEACKDCDYTTEIVYRPFEHEYVTVPAQASTCTLQGWEEYQECSLCGSRPTEITTLPLGEHQYNATNFYKCDVCGETLKSTATFKVGGEVVKTCEFEYGVSLTYPEDPVVEGYAFIGWYYEGTEIKQETTNCIWKTEDVVLEARFEKETVREITPTVGETIVGNTYRIYGNKPNDVLTITVNMDGEYVDVPLYYNGNLFFDVYRLDTSVFSAVTGGSSMIYESYIDVTFTAGEYSFTEPDTMTPETIVFSIDENCTIVSTSGNAYRVELLPETYGLIETEVGLAEGAVGNWYRIYAYGDNPVSTSYYGQALVLAATDAATGDTIQIKVNYFGVANTGYLGSGQAHPFTVIEGDGYIDVYIEACTFEISNASLTSPLTVVVDEHTTASILYSGAGQHEEVYKLVEPSVVQ